MMLRSQASPAPWTAWRKPDRPDRTRSRRPSIALVLPVLAISALMLLPVIYLLLRASDAGVELGDVLWRERTLVVLRNTVLLAVSVAGAASLIGVPLAWLTTRTAIAGRRFWALAATLPLVVPSYVGALTIVAAFGPRGLAHDLVAEPFGIERLPSIYGFWGSWLALTLFTFPYVFLSVQAALRGVDTCFEEAGRCLGLGPVRSFCRVVLPQLRPAIASGALLSALYTVSDFGVVTLMRYDVFTRAVYVQYRSSFDRTTAAALGLVLVAMTVGLLVVDLRIRGTAVRYRSGSGTGRERRLLSLGKWHPLGLAFCALVTLLSLGLPLGVLISWLVRGLSAGEYIDRIPAQALNTLGAGLLAGMMTAVLAFPVAWLAVRYPGRFATAAERIGFLGYALPGVVVAIAFVYAGANLVPPLYGTLGLLVVAYAVRFLPQALAAERLSLIQISPRLEEAARGLGKSEAGTLLRVTLPLARPGVLTGMAMVMLTVMKELPITLLLAPIGFETLATELWQTTSNGAYGRAALPAMVLIAISAVPSLLLTRHRDARRGDPPAPGATEA